MAVGLGSNGTPIHECWNGSRWSASPSGKAEGAPVALSTVDCLSRKFCLASGAYSDPSSRLLTLIERWQGSSWRAMPTPSP